MTTSTGLTAEQAIGVASALHAQGRLAEAEQLYRAALVLQPNHFDSLHALGIICLQREAPQEAMPPIARALLVNPSSSDAHNNLGIALAKLGHFAPAAAEYEKALILNPDFAAAHSNLGNALAALGKTDEAIARFQRALELEPDRADTHNDLGVVLATNERHTEAIAHFRRCLAVNPDFAEAFGNLANSLSAAGRHAEAIDYFRKVLARKPATAPALCGLGYSLHMADQPELALDTYREALAIDPRSAEVHRGLGLTLQTLGWLAEARKVLERAVELAPTHPAYHRALAEAKRFKPGDPQIAVLEELAANIASVPQRQRIELNFALGKVYEDLGQYERAFRHLMEGNAAKRRGEEYDEDATLTMLRHIEKVFTSELLQRKAGGGDPSELPIFILGMPRSGTTLVEQILASHPRVFGAGELQYLAQATKAFRGQTVRDYFPEVAKTLTAEQFRKFGARYLDQLKSRAPASAERATDKMPANFRFIGLIRLALPNARIVHAMRDPIDTCLSCFSKLFAGSQGFAYDLGDLGRYYRGYARLMEHWRSVLPGGAMLEIQYEELIADFENQARRLVAYCGLEWDVRCLAFHQTVRPVRTASVTQVRQPLYGSSVGRWRSYEPWLGPLFEELNSKL